MAEETPEPNVEEPVEEQSAANSGSLNVKRLVMLIGGILIVLLILGGVGFFLLMPKTQPAKPVDEKQTVVDRIGPRSIMEGVSKLQNIYKERTGRFCHSIQELWDGYETEPKGITAPLAQVLKEEIDGTNLFVRTIPNGFEIALRQDPTRWLVYSQSGAAQPKVSTQETDGPPPFGLVGTAAPSADVKVQELVEFKDPLGFFAIMLPGGFELDDGSKGQTARITFSYDSGVRMTIKAMEVSREWDPVGELAVKADQIHKRIVPAFAEFDLAVTNLLTVEGATGYEMGLVGRESKTGVLTHSFVFGGEKTTLSIALICSAPDGARLYEAIVSAVRDTFSVDEGPTALAKKSARKPREAEEKKEAEPEKPALTPEQIAQWNEAKTLLKTSGIMRSGDAYVALVNDRLLHVNETITVSIKNKPFKFMVTSITVDQVDFEPVLTASGGDDRVKM